MFGGVGGGDFKYHKREGVKKYLKIDHVINRRPLSYGFIITTKIIYMTLNIADV